MSVFAVGGGKGGVGRTLVATGFAVFIAQLGKKVLLVDGHPCAPQLGPSLGVRRFDGSAPPWMITASSNETRGTETAIPNLRVLSANTELGAIPGIALRRPREITLTAGAEQCVVDLGFGVGSVCLDAMLDADAMVLVTTPEPVAVEAVYRWIRHAYVRALSRRLKGFPVEARALHNLVRSSGGPPIPDRVIEAIAQISPSIAETAWDTLARLRARLVVNASRSRADLDLGESIAIVARQRLGVAVDYVGHIEYDEAVALAARRRRPLMVDAPAAKASRNLERIARKLLSLEAGRGDRPGSQNDGTTTPVAPTHYDVLALDRGASDEEIRRAYRRMREIYGPGSLAVAGLLTEGEIASAVSRIEEARDVLLDPARRRPYDLSVTAADELHAPTEPPAAETLAKPQVLSELLPELTPETEFSGELLRTIREARGIDLKDVATRTKISLANLRAIESEKYDALPATVYLRGFVAEVAKFLRLDVEQVTRSYLRRYRRVGETSAGRTRH